MGAMASQITSLTMVYLTVYSGADQRKYQSSISLAFRRGIHRSPANSPHKGPVTRKMFPLDDVIVFIQVWLNKMDDISKTTLFNAFLKGILIRVLMKFVLNPRDNK